MNADLSIRDATEADVPAILDIYNYEVMNGTATWDTEPRTLTEQRAWFAAHRPPYCVVVATVGDDVVGWGSLSRYHPRPGYRFTVEDTVYVRPDVQRRGIGRALLQALVARGRAGGFHTMLGKISGDNAASIELHRVCGFVEAGREMELGHKFDRWLDVVTMQLML
ncbi:MAG TPA: GNAT family N-acetyltransferase [Dehalococcoidia bacterium]|nr:GNAT family N-acetyltransferase [Dehalococcoidia bacterium]